MKIFDSIPIDEPSTELLQDINSPEDLRKLNQSQIPKLADELREFLLYTVGKTGGHFGAGLGVIELTLALHYKFDTPKDRIVWDVGHQTYPHKILTGRKDSMQSMRQNNGLAPFPVRSESQYDTFGVGHSSTSISAALGMITAAEKKQEDRHVTAVIGDGAMTAGMAYEAMNNAGALKSNLIVVLNDNDMSIARPVGAMSKYLANLLSGKLYFSLRETLKMIISSFSKRFSQKAGKAEDLLRNIVTGGTLFSELGFYYVGPIDGHDVENLVQIFENVKNSNHQGPVLIHVRTKKGKGYKPAEESGDKYHGVSKFNVSTGEQSKSKSNTPSYTKVFAETLIKHAEQDTKIIGITGAMPSGTGLNLFEKNHLFCINYQSKKEATNSLYHRF